MLKSLLSIEFALPTDMSESELYEEWNEIYEFLTKECCVQYPNVNQLNSNRLHSILCNLLMPFIASLYVICNVLLQVNS